jgi:membrane-bound serine protease (ClpP class)
VLILLAILAAAFVLPSPWGVVAIVAAVVIDVAEIAFGLWYARRRKPQAGAEALTGMRARATTRLDPVGSVRVHGELWRARSEEPVEPGEDVLVLRVDDELTLHVEPAGRPAIASQDPH